MTVEDVTRYFLYFTDYLSTLGFTEELAASVYIQDYFGAWCPYTDEYLPSVFQRVAAENARKYGMMCEIFAAEYDPLVNYDRTESETSVRTPSLTTSHNGTTSGTDNRQTLKKQIEHRAEKAIPPEGGEAWSETTTHSVSPYNTSNFSDAEKDVRTETGYRETEISYTGTDPDTDNVTRSGTESSTTTETGNEQTTRQLTVSGNIGTVTAQQMSEESLKLAEKMNIFRVIEKDLAAKMFLQVW